MKYYVIGDEDTVLGFGMVGVAGTVALDAAQARGAFSEVMASEDIGIILITERVADLIREAVDAYIFTSLFPLIVEIPDRLGKLPERRSTQDLIHEAIGITLE